MTITNPLTINRRQNHKVADFITNFSNHINAGFGGLTVKTVEVFDFVELLEAHKDSLGAIVLRFAPGSPLSVVSAKEISPQIGQLNVLTSSEAEWQRAAVNMLRSVKLPNEEDIDNASAFQRLSLKLAKEVPDGLSDDSIILEGMIRFVVVLQNVVSQEILKNQGTVQYLQKAAYQGRSAMTTYVIHSFDGSVGPQIEPYFPLLKFDTPGREEIKNLISQIIHDHCSDAGHTAPEEDHLLNISRACRGMTRRQVEDTTALLIRERKFEAVDAYKEAKIVTAEQNGLFTVVKPTGSTDKLFGLDGLQVFAKPLLKHTQMADDQLRPKGLLFVGPPGSGKTAAASMLATESHRTLCQVDLGTLRSKWVGETESRVDRMFELVESLAPAILLIDEIEKSLDGAQSSGETDGGLGSRVLGKFLTWAQDHEEDVLLVATANDITKITSTFPEMLRAERFDAMFMFDLPNPHAREAMWRYYSGRFGIKPANLSELVADSKNWTGAEIRACCRLAAIRGVDITDQLSLIPNVYKVATDVVEAVRSHATGRFIDADSGLIYNEVPGSNKIGGKVVRKRRKVS